MTLTLHRDLNFKIEGYLAGYKKFYHDMYSRAANALVGLEGNGKRASEYDITNIKNRFYMESLRILLRNISEKNRIIGCEDKLVQQAKS